MPLTSLKIPTNIQGKETIYQRIQITTDETRTSKGEILLNVSVAHCDKNWKPKGERLNYVRVENEEEFHKGLRSESAKKDHLITQMSTNPEWNPEGYKKLDEEIEVIAFRWGTPYKRIDPAVSIIVGAVADFYNGKIVFTPFKMERTGNKKHQKEYIVVIQIFHV